ncbi:peptidylprolyl isomerase [Sunxiuqinia dokdonensis]|nr:peptidylprolyl isomerase [Sunxiuqinia dokdonensis]
MHRFILLFFAILIAANGFGQTDSGRLIEIDDQVITKEEFIWLYEKNNSYLLDEAEKKSPADYLDLFINFKLKVLEAERLGYDTVPGFVSELKNYRSELAKPYLTSVHYTEQMVNTAYERMKMEVDASHILILLDKKATPDDTLHAWNKVMELRNQLLRGADFGNLAVEHSEDPSAKQNRGRLGYFSAFQMVYPFEDAAYKTAVGEITQPVQTSFGYHLIRVNNRRPAKGQIKVAHIMKRLDEHASEEAINQLKQQLDSLHAELKKGADFGTLAGQHSDDRRTAQNGGELSWFSSSGMMPEFSDPAFELENDGDLSPVIRTPYGLHIIKRIEYRPVPDFDELEDFLNEKIRNNPEISQHSFEIFIQNLKKEYKFEQNRQALDELSVAIESNTLKSFRAANPNQVLFQFADQKALIADFVDYLKDKANDNRSAQTVYDNFVNTTLIQYEDSKLEEKHPEFRFLMQEYHDGILLFNLSEDKIWNAAAKDSAGLEAFYQKNKSKYHWDERFHGWSIRCEKQEERDFIEAVFEEDLDIREDELDDLLNNHFEESTTKIRFGYFEKGADNLVDYLVWNAPKPEDFKDGLHFVRGNKVSPQAKTLEEARGLYISDYQNYLEEQWVKELRNRYRVKVNRKLLKQIEHE